MGMFSGKDKHSDLPQVPFYEYAKGGALHGMDGGKSVGEVMREEAAIERHREELKKNRKK